MESAKRATVLVTCQEEGCGFEQTVTLPREYQAEFADLDPDSKDQDDMIFRLVEDRVEGLECPNVSRAVGDHHDVCWRVVFVRPEGQEATALGGRFCAVHGGQARAYELRQAEALMTARRG
jgi:hypothetical protein